MKVKREACSCFALLHQQIGPGLKALSISLAKQENVKEQLQKCFEENPFNSSIQLTSWPRVSIVRQDSKLSGRGQTSSSALGLEVPKIDLFAALPDDIIAKLVRQVLIFTLCSS